MDDVLSNITDHQDQIIRILKATTEKDWLEKLGIVGGVVSGILVAIIGGLFTIFYNRSQSAQQRNDAERNNQLEQSRMKTQELTAVAALLPHLSGDNEKLQSAAFTTLKLLSNAEIAAALASVFPSPGSAGAMATMAHSPRSTEPERKLAEATLRFLRNDYITEFEAIHLTELAADRPYHVNLHPGFLRELQNLLGLGLIQRRPARGFRTLERAPEPRDVKEHFEITDAGRRYLAMRDALDEE